MSKIETIAPDWPAPAHVRALTTTRVGGVSVGAYASLNLGDHVGDAADAVDRNRTLLRESLNLPSEPLWLRQVHGTDVVDAAIAQVGATADGAWTDRRGAVLAVLTADCVPVFLCDKAGTRIALLHAGWRGLAAGIIDAGVRALALPSRDLLAYLGPGIGPSSFEVGEDVREIFERSDPRARTAFLPRGSGRWVADLYGLAQLRLNALGVEQVRFQDRCTLSERDLFFSYRRDRATGRMASLIWLD